MPAYWPFAQAIRAYVRDADPVGLAWQLGADGPELARLVPELRERVPSIEAPAPLEGDESRFRFFEAVAGFLTGIAALEAAGARRSTTCTGPTAPRSSCSASSPTGSPARRCCSSAPTGRRRRLPARTCAERSPSSTRAVIARRIPLAGLGRDAIARYLELDDRRARRPVTSSRRSSEQTGGNPFFVGEVVRLIATEGDLRRRRASARRGIPRGVSEAVSRRIERLSEGADRVLEVAAVVGREFDRRPARAGARAGRSRADLDAARAAQDPRARGVGPATASCSRTPSSARRSTRLCRRSRRQELHLRAGRAIEAASGADPDASPAGARAPLLPNRVPSMLTQARSTTRSAAARQAAEQLAHADAAEYLESAAGAAPGRRSRGGPAADRARRGDDPLRSLHRRPPGALRPGGVDGAGPRRERGDGRGRDRDLGDLGDRQQGLRPRRALRGGAGAARGSPPCDASDPARRALHRATTGTIPRAPPSGPASRPSSSRGARATIGPWPRPWPGASSRAGRIPA